jgi:hypothetical protein
MVVSASRYLEGVKTFASFGRVSIEEEISRRNKAPVRSVEMLGRQQARTRHVGPEGAKEEVGRENSRRGLTGYQTTQAVG